VGHIDKRGENIMVSMGSMLLLAKVQIGRLEIIVL